MQPHVRHMPWWWQQERCLARLARALQCIGARAGTQHRSRPSPAGGTNEPADRLPGGEATEPPAQSVLYAAGQSSTSGRSTRCSARNQTCISLRRRTGDHGRHVLGPVGSARDRGQLGGLPRVAHRDAAQHLHPLGELVDQLLLLLGMLVEQEMQLVEGRADHIPVVLLVERIQDQAVGQDPVQQLAAFPAHGCVELDRQVEHHAEPMHLLAHPGEVRDCVTVAVAHARPAGGPPARGGSHGAPPRIVRLVTLERCMTAASPAAILA